MLVMLAIASVVLGILLTTQLEYFNVAAAASVSVAIWITASSVYGIVHRLRNKRRRMSAVLHTPAAFWGMSIAHIGIAVFTVGVALTSIYTTEETVRMEVNDTHQAGGYTFTLASVENVRGPNFDAAEATFGVVRDNRDVGNIKAQKRIYDVRRDTMTEAGIDAALTRDLFVALGEPLENGRAWSVRIQTKPFIRWIWLGTIFMALGGLMAAVDRRYRRIAEKSAAKITKQASSTGDVPVTASVGGSVGNSAGG